MSKCEKKSGNLIHLSVAGAPEAGGVGGEIASCLLIFLKHGGRWGNTSYLTWLLNTHLWPTLKSKNKNTKTKRVTFLTLLKDCGIYVCHDCDYNVTF